jgi:hypothetical protein
MHEIVRICNPAPHDEEHVDHGPDFQPQPIGFSQARNAVGLGPKQSDTLILEQVISRISTPGPQSDWHPDQLNTRHGHGCVGDRKTQYSVATGRGKEQAASPKEEGQVTERDRVPELPQNVAVQALHSPTSHSQEPSIFSHDSSSMGLFKCEQSPSLLLVH